MACHFKCLSIFAMWFAMQTAAAEEAKLDRSLKPTDAELEEVSAVFKDMVVVQRKAKIKARKWLLNAAAGLDFSDGPKTMYNLQVNMGYAFSDRIELYFRYVPLYISHDRPIVSEVQNINVGGGQTVSLEMAEPKSAMGLDLLWAIAYGKDAFGPYSIIRSDTFFKIGVLSVQYVGGKGMSYSAMIGKTFFFSGWFNFRIAAGLASVETITNGDKQTSLAGLVEPGLMWYF